MPDLMLDTLIAGSRPPNYHDNHKVEDHMVRTSLLILNLFVSLVSAVVALVRPDSLLGQSRGSNTDTFYVRLYAARSIPFGLTVAIVPLLAGGHAVAWLLFTAAVIQFADVLIGVEKKIQGMMIGGSVAAIIHVLCGLAVL